VDLRELVWEDLPHPLIFMGNHLITSVRFSGKKAKFPKGFVPDQATGIGIDPGRKLGFATLMSDGICAYSGELGKDNTAKDAIALGRAIAQQFSSFPVVLEDAAPSKVFYQVPLAEIRFGLQIGLEEGGAHVTRLRPNSIRKQAFGGGNIRATDLWPLLVEHAADAAAMALVAALVAVQRRNNDTN
jgi:hypothetical protein